MREISRCECGKRKSKYASCCNQCWEHIQTEYQKKINTIREAIQNGMVFNLNTYLGPLEVNGVSLEGDWAYTGRDLSRRSWAICSNEICQWFREI